MERWLKGGPAGVAGVKHRFKRVAVRLRGDLPATAAPSHPQPSNSILAGSALSAIGGTLFAPDPNSFMIFLIPLPEFRS